MKVLYVDSCVRGEASRTRRLGEAFLQSFLQHAAEPIEVVRHDLNTMKLQPVDADTLMLREKICDARDWTDPLVRPAVEFAQADLVIIAAPYWDLSFPSQLKVWVEHMWVRNLTFRYENDQPVGLCQGKHAVYITTSGSPIGENDFGTQYIRAVTHTLGIHGFTRCSAEALDLVSSDVNQIMADAEQQVREHASRLAEELT